MNLIKMPWQITVSVLFSFIVLILKIYWLNDIPEAFAGAKELGQIVEGIMGSIIASYFFYIIVVHWKNINDQKLIMPHIKRWASIIVDSCKNNIEDFGIKSKTEIDFYSFTEKSIHNALKKINTDGISPIYSPGNEMTWPDYLNRTKITVLNNFDKIMVQFPFLDTELISLLTKIEDCEYFQVIDVFYNLKRISNKDLSKFSKPFYDYCKLCRELDDYIKNKIVGTD